MGGVKGCELWLHYNTFPPLIPHTIPQFIDPSAAASSSGPGGGTLDPSRQALEHAASVLSDAYGPMVFQQVRGPWVCDQRQRTSLPPLPIGR